MISVNNLSVQFTGTGRFSNVTFNVGDHDRIGLVGKNGAGKSTLLKIIHKELEPESGSIVITSGFKTGYLPQEILGNYDKADWRRESATSMPNSPTGKTTNLTNISVLPSSFPTPPTVSTILAAPPWKAMPRKCLSAWDSKPPTSPDP